MEPDVSMVIAGQLVASKSEFCKLTDSVTGLVQQLEEMNLRENRRYEGYFDDKQHNIVILRLLPSLLESYKFNSLLPLQINHVI